VSSSIPIPISFNAELHVPAITTAPRGATDDRDVPHLSFALSQTTVAANACGIQRLNTWTVTVAQSITLCESDFAQAQDAFGSVTGAVG
jgi:hypothetical protein